MTNFQTFEAAMSRALYLADRARETDDVPVGAVVIDPSGRIIGKGWNRREADHDPTAHAEIIALREAGRHLDSWNLSECTLVVTLEPCTMCAGAVVAARIGKLVFGAWDEKAGACGSVRDVVRDTRLNHQVEVVTGVMEEQVSVQLKAFFAEKRRVEERPDSPFWSKRREPYRPLDQRRREEQRRQADLAAAEERLGITLMRPTPTPAPIETATPPPIQQTRAAHKASQLPQPPPRRSDRHIGRVVVPPLELP